MQIERRFVAFKEIRAQEEEKIIEGYPIVYDQEADLGWFREKISKGAATNALKKSDEFVLFNHNPDIPLARRSNGTLEVTEDEHGVKIRADLSKSDAGPGVYKNVKSGLIDKMSFAFSVEKESWEFASDHTETDLRIIEEFRELLDYSPVTYPAYEQTSVSARSAKEVYESRKGSADPEQPGAPADDDGIGLRDTLALKAQFIIGEEKDENIG